ncbi:MAG: hypothetical protein R3B93_03445 [Bacteroidia bacterium]
MPIKVRDWEDKTLASLILEIVLPALKENPETAELTSNLNPESFQDRTIFIRDLIQSSLPLKKHPAFQEDFRILKTHTIAEIALPGSNLGEKMASRPLDWETAPESSWNELMEEANLDENQKSQLQYAFNLGKLTGDHFGLIKNLNADPKIQTTKDLAAWEKEDWIVLLENAGNITPNGEEKEEYIKGVMRAVEQTHPTHFYDSAKGREKTVQTGLQAASQILLLMMIYSVISL